MAEAKSSVTEHATLMGSSTAERVINCPASPRLIAKSPRQPASEAAIRGTALHSIAEHILLNGGSPVDFVGSEVATVEIDAAAAADVNLALQSVDELIADGFEGSEQFIELRVTHTPVKVFGTGDFFAVTKDGKRALSADHKFGWVEVAADNYQGKFICATALTDPTTRDIVADVEEFRIAVIQPAFEPAHTFIDVSREDIEQFQKTIDLAITAAESPDAPAVIGKWCTFCEAKLICPAWKQRTEDLIDLKKHHKDWTPARISEFLHLAKDIAPLFEAAKERAKHELENGRPIPGVTIYGEARPGWRLTTGRKMQSWIDPVDKTIALLRGTFGLKTKVIQDVISPAQAKKLLPKDQHATLDLHIDVKLSAPSLAPADDTGAPAVPAAAFSRAAQAAALAAKPARK